MKPEQNANFDDYMASITTQVQNISEQIRERKDSYKKCLGDFKKHLTNQAAQIERTQMASQEKNRLIRKSYEQIYHGLNQDCDTMLRYIKQTYEAKKMFWKQTIADMAGDNDIGLKRDLHLAKAEAHENYLEAIDQRKTKPVPYAKLVSISQRDRTLINYQQSNRALQANIYNGTMLRLNRSHSNTGPRQFDNKQNSMQNWGKNDEIVNSRSKGEVDPSGILTRFMKR